MRKKINFNTVLRNYMYERFIERLAHSHYKNNFIFKGGFYLSTIFGVDLRHTKVDFPIYLCFFMVLHTIAKKKLMLYLV